MARLIKRYGSRKLYDTQESRYISLEEIAEWVRSGEEIEVIDNASSDDVTALTLTQVISEEGRKKSRFLSSDLLHDLVRNSGTMVTSSVKQIQDGVNDFVKKSFDRIVPVSNVRAEMTQLRDRLEELEQALVEAETKAEQQEVVEPVAVEEPVKPAPKRRTRSTSTAKSTTKTTRRKRTTAKATKAEKESTEVTK